MRFGEVFFFDRSMILGDFEGVGDAEFDLVVDLRCRDPELFFFTTFLAGGGFYFLTLASTILFFY